MFNTAPLKIGVISDTHLPYRLSVLPPKILEAFAGVDLILHAGDVDKINLLQPLTDIAPLYAVRGNVHVGDFSLGGRDLPPDIHLTLAGRQTIVTHGHFPGLTGFLRKGPELLGSLISHSVSRGLNDKIAQRLKTKYPQANIIIFGHTHAAYSQIWEETLFFNPGAVAPTPKKWSSIGIIELLPDSVITEIIPLEKVELNKNQKNISFRRVFNL